MKMNFKITNIHCDACVKLSDSALKSISGVTGVVIEKNGATVIESDQEIAWEKITSALAKVGKEASLI